MIRAAIQPLNRSHRQHLIHLKQQEARTLINMLLHRQLDMVNILNSSPDRPTPLVQVQVCLHQTNLLLHRRSLCQTIFTCFTNISPTLDCTSTGLKRRVNRCIIHYWRAIDVKMFWCGWSASCLKRWSNQMSNVSRILLSLVFCRLIVL